MGSLPVTLEFAGRPSVPPDPEEATFGPGPNAPAWEGKTVYPEELFLEPLPVAPESSNAAGALGYQGFDGYFGATYFYKKTEYPVVSTPIGTKPVLRTLFPGSRKSITGAEQSTDVWDVRDDQGWSVKVSGTWSGTLQFEISTDGGGSWGPVTMVGSHGGTTGSSTTTNGAWDEPEQANTIFRVRASAWTSGTAVVDVGHRGGFGPGKYNAGRFTGDPTRIYVRTLVRVDPEWNNNGNAGTKFLFYSQIEGNNHFLNLWNSSGSVPEIYLQQTASNGYTGSAGPANGEWMDLEMILTAGTAGGSDGTAKVWINNTLLLDQTGIPFFAEGTTPRFTVLFVDPTYGGGRRPPYQTFFYDNAGWYRESAP
jgi:hypothetical protein